MLLAVLEKEKERAAKALQNNREKVPPELERMKKELADSLRAEEKIIEKQMSLYEQFRDLKIAVARAEVEEKLAELQAHKEKVAATKKSTR